MKVSGDLRPDNRNSPRSVTELCGGGGGLHASAGNWALVVQATHSHFKDYVGWY
jgi:hypothetical protein